MRTVDTESYLDMVKGLVQEGKEVSVRISGGSMSPFLAGLRDTILISPITRPLKRGDMALFQRISGQYVMHRIRYVRKEKGQEQYYFIGDAQIQTEGPIERDQICGVITAVQRKGKWLKQGSFWWEFFRIVWLRMIPLRRPLINLYSILAQWVREGM